MLDALRASRPGRRRDLSATTARRSGTAACPSSTSRAASSRCCNADRSILLVCNGEIYNYRELRRELERDGYPFLTHSDCEVIIALYERHGDRLLDHLRGMFAFVLWDATRRACSPRAITSARSRSTTSHRGAASPSRRRSRRCSPSTPHARADESRGARSIPRAAAHRCAAVDVRRHPQAAAGTLAGRSKPAARRAIRPLLATWRRSRSSTGSEESLCDELEAQVEEALRLHLVSDVPVGAFLSGGLDSSLLVAMLAAALGVAELPTFTMGLPYQRFDEAPAARAVAALFGTEHHERTLDASLTEIPAAADLPRSMSRPIRCRCARGWSRALAAATSRS